MNGARPFNNDLQGLKFDLLNCVHARTAHTD